jgi:Transposase family tnp2
LGLGYQKIDVCSNHCTLYYGINSSNETCDNCGHSHFKERGESAKGKPVAHKVLNYLPITPRLQQLYLSPVIAENMRWHKEGMQDKEGIMVHPADGEAWKHFDSKYPEFAVESRNVRFGLSTDGFLSHLI